MFRGGCGQIINIKINSNIPYFISPKCERTKYAAVGLNGGLNGKKGELLINNKIINNSKKDFEIMPGTNITFKLPGGGGNGDPLERKTNLVLDDVINGIVSNKSAKNNYGVIIIKEDNKYVIKKRETILLRRELKMLRNTQISNNNYGK